MVMKSSNEKLIKYRAELVILIVVASQQLPSLNVKQQFTYLIACIEAEVTHSFAALDQIH